MRCEGDILNRKRLKLTYKSCRSHDLTTWPLRFPLPPVTIPIGIDRTTSTRNYWPKIA